MDFNTIKGFKKLSPEAQEIFKRTFKKHQAALGTEAKKEYTPTSVKFEKGYLKVTFKNGEYLYYTKNEIWY